MDTIKSTMKLAVQLEARAKEIQYELANATKVVQKEREEWEREKVEMNKKFNINDNIIELNVGGTYYTTYKSVLCSKPSMLQALFSGRHPVVKDSAGRYFIDCDGETFGYVLNYLRRNKMVWPTDNSLKQRVTMDLDFFGISLPFDSTIIVFDSDEHKHLLKLFPQSITQPIYRATVDGWTAEQFHKKVKDIPNTLTLIRVNTYVFGGFIPHTWNSVPSGNYGPHNVNSFLFSLSNPKKSHLGVKFQNKSGNNSHYYNNTYCATFGGGHDIYISSDSVSNTHSYTNLGHSYVHPLSASGTKDQNFFCGSDKFTPNEIEVFQVE